MKEIIQNNPFLLQIIYLSALLLMYQIFHRKQNRWVYNRILLWGILAVSLIFPFIRIDAFPIYKSISNDIQTDRTTVQIIEATESFWTWENIYFSVAGILLVFTLIKIIYTYVEISKDARLSQNSSYDGPPKTFFNKIAVPDLNDNVVIAHERHHKEAGHSYDRVMVEVLHSICWFNPMFFIFKKFLLENHEFAADEFSMQSVNIDARNYLNHLYQARKKDNSYLSINHTFASQIKNRITMITQPKKYSSNKGWIILLPIIGLFAMFSLQSYTVITPQVEDFITTLDTIPNERKFKKIFITTHEESDRVDTTVVYDFSNPSGNKVIVSDTNFIIDIETFEETVTVESLEIPAELKQYFPDYNIDQFKKIMIEFEID